MDPSFLICILLLVASWSSGIFRTFAKVSATPSVDIPEIVKLRIDRMAYPQNYSKPDAASETHTVVFRES
jgi:hypothetical protein